MFKGLFRLFTVKIPLSELIISHSKSSGPGGQHVNKTNSKVDIRFSIDTSNWISEEVKVKLKTMFPHFINKEGEMFVQSQSNLHLEHRDQKSNEADAIEKLQSMIDRASEPEKVRECKESKEHEENRKKRIEYKRARSEIKSLRRNKFDY